MAVFKKWNDLPAYMKNNEVKYYYNILKKKKLQLHAKRIFDIVIASICLLFAIPFLIGISVIIKLDSSGPVVFKQIRVTQYGRKFKILKFRTMVTNAEKIGTQVTTVGDHRITNIGAILRKYRLDEIPQLINILVGDMSFVGTRPEVPDYVKQYSNKMKATLLLPAGVTSEASILYKDEDKQLMDVVNVDETYISEILPAKMKYNLKSLESYSFVSDFKTMIRTVIAVIK